MSKQKKGPNAAQLRNIEYVEQPMPAFLQRLRGIGGSNSNGRESLPERPDAGSDAEDDDDERPQVVVLKEGKHLSAEEVEREKRRARGVIDEPEAIAKPAASPEPSSSAKPATKPEGKPSVQFGGPSKPKRKAVGVEEGDAKRSKPSKSKGKSKTGPLSFG